MGAKFECEVRFLIKDIGAHKKQLQKIGGKLKYRYAFTDYYYRPEKKVWGPIRRIIRIRKWSKGEEPTTIYFVKNEIIESKRIKFKRSMYPEGKLPLFSGSLKRCREILTDLDFVEWITLKKQRAEFWDIPKYKFGTAIEYIPGLGWTGELEVEGNNIQKAKEKLERQLKLINIDQKQADFRPISVIYAEKLNLL